MEPTFLSSLFDFAAGGMALRQVVASLGTAVSGMLGSITLSLFLVSLMWGWVRSRFETWTFWDLFLRLIIVAAGLSTWTDIFMFVDEALDSVTTLSGTIHPQTLIRDVLLTPYTNVLSPGTNVLSFWSIFAGGPFFMALSLLLYFLAWAMYNIDVVGAIFGLALLYVLGPLFLACFVFDPLRDLWMHWLRFYLTIKAWVLVLNVFLFLVSSFMIQPFTASWSGTQAAIMADTYLLFLIVGFIGALPVARALVGGAGHVFVSGNFLPGAAAGAAGAVATAGGVAAGALIGGPAGAAVGGAAGSGAAAFAKAGASAAAPTREA
ncbi:MAG: type IV secretion system protein [Halothiobacillaceae bacterium]